MNEAKLKANVAAVEQQYRASTPRSAQLFERALQSLPGGNTRTTIYMQPYPFYFDHGKGYTIYDIDDNERIDFINNYTSGFNPRSNQFTDIYYEKDLENEL